MLLIVCVHTDLAAKKKIPSGSTTAVVNLVHVQLNTIRSHSLARQPVAMRMPPVERTYIHVLVHTHVTSQP